MIEKYGTKVQNIWEVMMISLRLGLTSFGGPIAHLGYFEHAYVKKKKWLSHEDFSRMVALCQLLPGPTSSQVNFLIGLQRAGLVGGVASFAGFTIPSALFMYGFAVFAPKVHGQMMEAVLHGLKLVAVAIVAQAVWGMATRLCPDRTRTGIALVGMAILLLIGGAFAQVGVIVVGALAGSLLCRDARQNQESQPSSIGKRSAWAAFGMFVIFLVGLPLLSAWMPGGLSALMDVSYRSGALVFGGGHVVLPLLRDAMVPAGWMTDDVFLAGYGVAQAVPGPLFALSSYLGAVAAPTGVAALWASVTTIFIFLPGMLAALAGVPLWRWMSKHTAAQGALAGINAAVVGILSAALYDPVWQTAILSKSDIIVAVTGYFLLERWKIPPVLVVVLCVIGSVLSSLL
jgi:chromate transporter